MQEVNSEMIYARYGYFC